MTDKIDQKKIGENIAAIILLCLCTYGCVSWNSFKTENKKREEQEKIEEELADARNREAHIANEQKAAADMHVPYELYNVAKAKFPDAIVSCKKLVKARANWQVESNFIPSNNWIVTEEKFIRIYGDDMTGTNGFGAERKIKYRCSYNLTTDEISLDSAK